MSKNDIRDIDFLFSENPNPMWIYDPSDLSIRHANDAASKLYGYSREELQSITIADLRPKSEIPKLKEEVSRQVQSFSDAGIWKHRKKNGDLLYVRVLSHPISMDGETLKLVSVHDVTGEFQSQLDLRMLLDNTLDGIMLTSPDGRILKANQAACEMLGMTEEEIIRKGREGLVYSDEKLRAGLEERERTGSFSGELTFIHGSGRKIPVELSTSVYTNLQGEKRTSMMIRDISRRRKLETLLDEAYSLARIGAWEVDPQNEEIYWSSMTKRLHEVGPDFEPDLETGINFYKEGEHRETIREAIDKAINEGIPWDEELKIITAEENERWVRSKGEPEMVDGTCRRVYGILQDIHERKQAREKMLDALQERERILERITEAFFAVDENWTVTYWNSRAEEIIGKSREEVLGQNLWEKFPEAKELEFFKQYKRAFETQEPISFEEQYPPLDVWLELNAYPSLDGLSVFFRDITDRRQDQIDLKKAYREKETILESIADGFFTVKRDWTVTYWNSAAERLLETPKEAILGEHLWEVFSDATHLPSYTNYQRVMEEGVPVDFEDYYAPLDRWYDISAYPSEEGISVYFKDVTDQKQREAQLHESLKEKETLLAEVHHRVKNNLAVVSGMMQLQAFEESDETVKQKLRSSVGRIKTMALIHELLYQSESFSRLESDANIKKLVEEIAHYYEPAIDTDLRFDLQKVPLNINQAMPVCLIINEVVTNIFKHTFKEKGQGRLQVRTLTGEDDRFTLKIIDDGKELPEDFPESVESSSLGLQLIETLAEQLGAEYGYASDGGETQFTLTFKKTDVRGPAATGVL